MKPPKEEFYGMEALLKDDSGKLVLPEQSSKPPGASRGY